MDSYTVIMAKTGLKDDFHMNKIISFIILVVMTVLQANAGGTVCAQGWDLVSAYSHNFYRFFGFYPYKYFFGDSRGRSLSINFLGRNSLVLENVPTGYDNLCFTDTIYFHADSSICSNGIAANRNQLLVDSIASQRHASSADCVKPYRNTELTSTYAVFPRLQPRRDTIFVSTDYKVLRIRDFDFTISRCAKYPDGSALREPNVKFQPLENMRPQRYRAFLEELRQENRSPDDYLLEFIDKYYDWGNENGKR